MPIEGNVNSPPYIEGRVSGNISSFHSLSGEVTVPKGSGAIELFWAAYGTTTYGEIEVEYRSGKQILVRYLNYICNLVRFEDEQFIFSCILPGESDSQSVVSLICAESGWEASTAPVSADSAFWVRVFYTPYLEILEAFQSNKIILATDGTGDILELSRNVDGKFLFSCVLQGQGAIDEIAIKYVECTSSGWSSEEIRALNGDYSQLYNLPSINGVQLVGSIDASDLGLAAASDVHNIPSGGNTGDILVKNSNGNYDASWVSPANAVEQDNTLPITSAAVYTEVGNINALLATI